MEYEKPKEELISLDDLFEEMDRKEALRTQIEKCYWWCHFRIVNVYYDIKSWPYRLYTRVRYGYDPRDLWGLDIPIAKFVYPRIKAFRELYNTDKCSPGYPGKFTDEEKYPGDTGYKIWLEILDKIVYAFGHLNKYEDWNLPTDDIKTSDIRNGNVKYDIWRKANDEHCIKLQEAFKLFGENFGSFWD